MSKPRMVATIVVGFLVSQVLAVVVHGFLLARDYAPFEGTLLRAAQGQATAPWQMLFLPVAHLSFISAMVWLYGHLQMSGPATVRGLTLGVFGWVVGQVPLWLLWYAQQPWPGGLVVKQLGLELLSSLIIGLAIAFAAGSTKVTAGSSLASRDGRNHENAEHAELAENS
jgi:hypothetical protein